MTNRSIEIPDTDYVARPIKMGAMRRFMRADGDEALQTMIVAQDCTYHADGSGRAWSSLEEIEDADADLVQRCAETAVQLLPGNEPGK